MKFEQRKNNAHYIAQAEDKQSSKSLKRDGKEITKKKKAIVKIFKQRVFLKLQNIESTKKTEGDDGL